MMRLSLGAALCLCAAAMTAAAARAQQAPRPSAERARTVLETCLADKREWEAERCQSAYSRSCQEALGFGRATTAECLSAEADAWRSLMEEWYGELVSIVEDREAPYLQAAHQAWLAWRDAECEWAQADSPGGADGCRNRENGRRAIVYRVQLDYERPRWEALQRLNQQD